MDLIKILQGLLQYLLKTPTEESIKEAEKPLEAQEVGATVI